MPGTRRMSVDILHRPDGPLDAWITPCPDYAQTVVPPGGHYGSYRTSSPIVTAKKLDRPKSGPTCLGARGGRKDSLTSHYSSTTSVTSRPKTALGTCRSDCDRVLQVEHEGTRKHNLETHLPVKKPRTPPWQKALDTPPVPCVVTPGYILSRSKSKVAMTIKTDDFFDAIPLDRDALRAPAPRDPLIAQLHQQIDDLTLYLEEERLNHKDTKRKAADHLRDTVEDLNYHHENEIKSMQSQFQDQLESLRQTHESEMESLAEESENTGNKMRGEVEFLQGAFDSYKSQLHQETDERWRKREAELHAEQDAALQDRLKELRARVQSERTAEKNDVVQQHHKQIQTMREDHKKEINQLMRRFSNAAKEMEEFKKTREELEETKRDFATLREDYDEVCQQVTGLSQELADTKVELATFQQTFQDRVQLIDDKYRDRIHDLLAQNTELRRLYVRKCGELFDEKTESENSRVARILSAKEAMKVVIGVRNDALVNLAATDPEFEKRVRTSKSRPSSAPNTRNETEKAILSASETDSYVQIQEERKRPKTCKPRILDQILQEKEAKGDGPSEEHSGDESAKDNPYRSLFIS